MTAQQTPTGAEPPVVAEAQAMAMGTGDPARLLEAFRASILYAERAATPHPSVVTSTVEGQGTWICLWSTVDRLHRICGEAGWFDVLGSDLLDNILPNLVKLVEPGAFAGLYLDAGTEWAFPLLSKPAPPEIIAAVAEQPSDRAVS